MAAWPPCDEDLCFLAIGAVSRDSDDDLTGDDLGEYESSDESSLEKARSRERRQPVMLLRLAPRNTARDPLLCAGPRVFNPLLDDAKDAFAHPSSSVKVAARKALSSSEPFCAVVRLATHSIGHQRRRRVLKKASLEYVSQV